MKFDEISNPKCDRCGVKDLQSWSAMVDQKSGDVTEVYCSKCKDVETLVEWDKDHRLHSNATLSATLKTHEYTPRPKVDQRWYEINMAYTRVNDVVKAYFEPSVWFGHGGDRFTTIRLEYVEQFCGFGKHLAMANVVRDSRNSWMVSGDVTDAFGTFTVKTWCTAGRCLIEIETTAARITLITAEDEDALRMGIQGIDATETEAIDLLNRAEMAWRAGTLTLTDKTT